MPIRAMNRDELFVVSDLLLDASAFLELGLPSWQHAVDPRQSRAVVMTPPADDPVRIVRTLLSQLTTGACMEEATGVSVTAAAARLAALLADGADGPLLAPLAGMRDGMRREEMARRLCLASDALAGAALPFRQRTFGRNPATPRGAWQLPAQATVIDMAAAADRLAGTRPPGWKPAHRHRRATR